MSDNDNEKCPLCGKETNKGEPFCRDCQEIAQNAYSDRLMAHEDNEENTAEVEPFNLSEEAGLTENNTDSEIPLKQVRSNKNLYIFVAIGIVLLLAAGGFSSYNYIIRKSSAETEDIFWNKCIEENTPLSYSKYLLQYPDGRFNIEAENKIRQLRQDERNEWENLRNSNNVDALFAFLSDHPETPYKREITQAIDSLSWLSIAEENSAESYLAYLENVKLGRYSGKYELEAQERYNYLSQLKTLEGDELHKVKETLNNYFQALSSSDAQEFSKQSSDSVGYFFKSQNKTPKAIHDSLRADMKIKRIRQIDYTFPADSLEVIQDNKGIYFVSLPLSEEITFNDRKKKKQNRTYPVKMELNAEMRVTSLLKVAE